MLSSGDIFSCFIFRSASYACFLVIFFYYVVDIHAIMQPMPRTSACQVKTSVPPSFASFPPSVVSTQFWLRQDDSITDPNHSSLGASTSVVGNTNMSSAASIPLQPDVTPSENLV